MKKKFAFGSLLVCLLALGMVFVGCNNGTTKVDPTDKILDGLGLDREKIREIGLDTSALEGAKSGDFILIWGGFDGTTQAVDATITAEGWQNVQSVTSGWGKYVTGKTAVEVLNYCVNNLPFFMGGGSIDTAENLIAYEGGNPKEGAPEALKTAMEAQVDNAPIAGVFKNNAGAIVVFFMDKIK